MNLNIDWSKDFQEFQEILNSGIHPEWLYCAKANLVLEPTYTGEGEQLIPPLLHIYYLINFTLSFIH
ncbi:hypothetical protein [Staphylococcus aureus]